MKPEHKNGGAIRTFLDTFSSYMRLDDYVEFHANRIKAGTQTFLDLDVYQGDKLATIVVEQYAVRSKLQGCVIVAIPEPEYGIPIFSFQMGGNKTQSIALVDLSPTAPDIDYTPIRPVCEKYRQQLGLEPSKIDWVNAMYSPLHLHCHYAALDENAFIAAMAEYLDVWIEHYYKPAVPLTDPAAIQTVTDAILRYKRILHENDPAHGIFAKAWGRPVADAFMHLETRDHPALPLHDEPEEEIVLWKNTELNISWTRDAQEQVMEAPITVHHVIRNAIETKASAANIALITADVFDRYKEAPPAG